MARQIRI